MKKIETENQSEFENMIHVFKKIVDQLDSRSFHIYEKINKLKNSSESITPPDVECDIVKLSNGDVITQLWNLIRKVENINDLTLQKSNLMLFNIVG